MRQKLRGISRYRPRFLTLVVLLVTAALLVLANCSDDFCQRRMATRTRGSETLLPTSQIEWPFDVEEPETGDPFVGQAWNLSFGWPLLWNQYITLQGYGYVVVGWRYSASRLAGNVAMWLVMLLVSAGGCEWLLRRYGLRWSMRTMLAAVAILAAFCGWLAWARDRANADDALIDAIQQQHGQVWLQRWGPKWLDLVGADRYRRRIVAAKVVSGTPDFEDDRNECGRLLLERLSKLNHLQYLVLAAPHFTPDFTRALGELHQLRALAVDNPVSVPEAIDVFGDAVSQMQCLRTLRISPGTTLIADDEQAADKWLAAIAQATLIEHLQLSDMTMRPESLMRLAGLNTLNSLCLDKIERGPGSASRAPLLSGLPRMARLEDLHLQTCDVGDGDLRYLVRLPGLRSLRLRQEEPKITGVGLKQLASLVLLSEAA
ncbi:MAG: hypothetical protein ACREHD_32995 [Pirellulales bacterium]